jgi:hypothetical protein
MNLVGISLRVSEIIGKRGQYHSRVIIWPSHRSVLLPGTGRFFILQRFCWERRIYDWRGTCNVYNCTQPAPVKKKSEDVSIFRQP